MVYQDIFCASSVKLKPLPTLPGDELSECVYRRCFFCQKDCKPQVVNKSLIDRLSGPGRHYCSFCLRHGFNTKNVRHILPMSFRGIIGHFCHRTHTRKMYLSDIEDYIHSHSETGLMNPAFVYDPDTFLWFVDFSRVGKSTKKVPVSAVLHTVTDILTCFNLNDTVGPNAPSDMYAKYREAILQFYEKRYRPADRPMLIPSVDGVDKWRGFTHLEMFGKK